MLIALCAEWCGVCRSFRTEFEAAELSSPAWAFHWIDVEEWPEADAVDVDTFPTVVLADRGGTVRFAGAVVPGTGALARLLRHASQRPDELAAADELAARLAPLVEALRR
jgi:thioredoxin 1